MPEYCEEKEKCLEKLSEMQKYIPFLDFMIDKIKKKNNEISLDCQLNKFQLLKSMIVEKNGKHSWDVIVKIEDVIEKLIAKLNYKEICNSHNKEATECSYERLEKKDSSYLRTFFDTIENKTMAASLSLIPSSTTTTISVTSASGLSNVTTVDSCPQDSPTNTVDLIMKTLKTSLDNSVQKSRESEKINEPLAITTTEFQDQSKSDNTNKILETDLRKDLDGFELTDCPTSSESNSNNAATEFIPEAPEKLSSPGDLLSSSREKLLKSLQRKLCPPRSEPNFPPFPTDNKKEIFSDKTTNSAFSCVSYLNMSEPRTKSDLDSSESQSNCNKNISTSKENYDLDSIVPRKPSPVHILSPIPFYTDNSGSDLEISLNECSKKQKLREKLSADICEVYKVPGKSVGGSLRSLKDSKDLKKALPFVEEELFKPDKVTEVRSSQNLRLSTENNSVDKSQRNVHSTKKDDKIMEKKTFHRYGEGNQDRESPSEDKEDDINVKSCESKFCFHEPLGAGRDVKLESNIKSLDQNSKKEKNKRNFHLSLDNQEMLSVVKENRQSLGHLSKFKSSELKKSLNLSVSNSSLLSEDALSEDSLQDLDEFMNDANIMSDKFKLKPTSEKNENSQLIPPGGLKAGTGSATKDIKPVTELPKGEKKVVGENTLVDCGEETLDEEDFVQKLIEETTPNIYSAKKNQRLLDVPLPKAADLFDTPSEISNTFSSNNPRDPRRKKIIQNSAGCQNVTVTSRSEMRPSINSSSSRLVTDVYCSTTTNTITTTTAAAAATTAVANSSSVTASHYTLKGSVDCIYNPRPLGCFGGQNISVNSCTDGRPTNQILENLHGDGKSDLRHPNSTPNLLINQNFNKFPQFTNLFPVDPSDHIFRRSCGPTANTKTDYCALYNNELQRHNSYHSSEPKSYAEYKRRKIMEQEKLSHQELHLENRTKSDPSENSHTSEVRLSDKDEPDKNCHQKLNDSEQFKHNDSPFSQTNSKIYYLNCSYDNSMSTEKQGSKEKYLDQSRKTSLKQESQVFYKKSKKQKKKKKNISKRRNTTDVDERRKTNDSVEVGKTITSDGRRKSTGDGEKRKMADDQKMPAPDSEEFVSPLDKLYQNENKPQTGRGYGLQKFKIPKKQKISVCEEGKNQKPSKIKESEDQDIKHIVSNKIKNETEDLINTKSCNSNEDIKGTNKCCETVDPQPEKLDDGKELEQTDLNITEGPKCTKNKIVTNNTNNKIADSGGLVRCSTGSITVEIDSKINTENVSVTNVETKTTLDKDKNIALHETSIAKSENQEQTASNNEQKNVKTNDGNVKECDTQVAECDSSAESLLLSNKTQPAESNKAAEKNVVSKEEITQEFVEALIRKSFQCGEGKLLLAQAKLFEEFTRKLNSKKLKTIQKIINSESDSDSTSSSDSSSEEEKRKKKNKKSEDGREKVKRSKKKKKKFKKSKKYKSSTSSETEESSEDEIISKKKGESKKVKVKEENKKTSEPEVVVRKNSKENEEGSEHHTPISEAESRSCDSSVGNDRKDIKQKSKNKRRGVDLGSCISKKRKQRKQGQKKLLEKYLKDEPQQEGTDGLEKEPETKIKTRAKGKVKTELDRLHDDIRSMFISSGVVTATGQRMCRILKESGGDMNNLDIVKESAKMVEEEKLRRVRTRLSVRNTRSSNREKRYRSRSLSFDESSSCERSKSRTRENSEGNTNENLVKGNGQYISCLESFIEKSKRKPVVVLERTDLSRFGFGVKISDDRISFSRMRGNNTAMRGRSWRGSSDKKYFYSGLEKNVYLARNKRKIERMKGVKMKRGYAGKKLMDIIKNLPLKMAKMKHLELCERKGNERSREIKRKRDLSAKSKKYDTKKKHIVDTKTLNSCKLLDYAFEKKRHLYSCRLCSHVTKNITGHYKTFHSNSEVLISRLSKTEAERAIADSKENNYNVTSLEQGCSLEMIRRRVRSKLNGSISYNCRMCNNPKTTDINAFFTHITSHTGEYRFKCPAEGCSTTMSSREYMRFHILSNHPKAKQSLFNKIIELYSVPIEWGNLFGFLCSKCNFVQILQSNLENHIANQHSADENATIIKIDMSASTKDSWKSVRKPRTWKNGSKKLVDDESSEEIENEDFIDVENLSHESDDESQKSLRVTGENEKKPDVRKLRQRKVKSEAQNNESESSHPNEETEEMDTKGLKTLDDLKKSDKTCEDMVTVKTEKGLGNSSELTMELNETKNCNDGDLLGSTDVEDCVDLKNISTIKGSDIIDPIDGVCKKESLPQASVQTSKKNIGLSEKLKVGPLEAHIMDSSEVLYECFVKGCVFSTKMFDLFEKHIIISHAKLKWKGHCDLCADKIPKLQYPRSFKLICALKHLKFHVGLKKGDESVLEDDFIRVVNISKLSEDSSAEAYKETENSTLEPIKIESENSYAEEDSNSTKTEDNQSPYPVKPLLRVRSFLGDRLSKPKEGNDNSTEDKDVITISEEDTLNNPEGHVKEVPALFTIENVRSLTSEAESEENLKNDEVSPAVEVKSEVPPNAEVVSGKPVLVRSRPTRKIAIRPEPSALPIEVGHLQLVQGQPVPVVLSPISASSPVKIVSSAAASKSSSVKFAVKPVMVSASPSFFTTTNAASALPPVSSTLPTTSISTLISSNTETNCPVQTTTALDSASASQVSLNTSSESFTGPCNTSDSSKRFRTKVYRPNKGGIEPPQETSKESEQKDKNLRRLPLTSSMGNKSVKDAKIYKQMLKKNKLCHLFKCMAIECSFTCNDESVFTQHLGLHKAQRKMKAMKTVYVDNNMKKVFNWQQCAYCCEVLLNTSSALSQHILNEHGHCIYQCGYCFYRAVSPTYVEAHQNFAHNQTIKGEARVIYKCKAPAGAFPQPNTLEKQGRRQSVRPYYCDQCGSKFFITQEFMDHLTTEHRSVTAYTCHICKNICFKADRLISHYKLHSYSTYQCAYCLHGTETEKEMVFHLCNFHFSQPAYMYVRALANGQKPIGSQIDSLKVILYESETLNPDCIEEASPDTPQDDASNSLKSSDISSIVAELGINTENDSANSMTPLMKELASIGNMNTSSLCVKTLLPNAKFSSEKENGNENCSVLISSGISSTSDQSGDKDISLPLGQLPLETINIQSSDVTLPTTSPEKGLKLNEIVVNINYKENETKDMSLPKVPTACHKMPPPVVITRKACAKNVYATKNTNVANVTSKSSEQSQGDIIDLPSNQQPKCDSIPNKELLGHHKLPSPIVVTRKTCAKNVYPAKNQGLLKKKPDDLSPEDDKSLSLTTESDNQMDISLHSISSGMHKKANEEDLPQNSELLTQGNNNESDQPLITGVVSLSSGSFEEQNDVEQENLPKISDVCSLSENNDLDGPRKIVINIQSQLKSPNNVLKPPIIRVEDFPLNEEIPISLSTLNSKQKVGDDDSQNSSKLISENKMVSDDKVGDKSEEEGTPEIIILEENPVKDVLTVTIDSEDEKDDKELEKCEKTKNENQSPKKSNVIATMGDDTIRKEMERLRNQIADETDCLLFDDSVSEKPQTKLTLSFKSNNDSESVEPTALLSPIEEAICSLNKKLESESVKDREDEEQIKVEDTKNNINGSGKKANVSVSVPRTRSLARKEGADNPDKSDSDDSNLTICSKADKSNITKRFNEELVGKDLYICGNEKCNFASEEDTSLKDHLYICDLSRESSVLVCPHCSKQIKHFNPYIEHIKHHGEKRFSCGLCSFTSAVENSIIRHAKQKHKCHQLKSLPRDPPKEGYLVFYPKTHKVEKQDFEVNGYSPGDEDKLPLQSVYNVNVKCAKCPYFTKVRSNMVRHLKIHLKSVETEGSVVVPSTAPTNPVPCLDTKERMFDKMTNLAASSQLAQAKEKTVIEMLTPEEEAKLPQFVTEQMRYKCCLPDCNYITVDDGMLKHHIKALHDEINYYSCPHCKSTVHVDVRHVTLDKIGHHLKHHDTKLYKCAHCIYFHYQKSVVEKHTIEKHPERRYYVHTVREPKVESASEEEQSSNDSGFKVWKCGFCQEFQSPSRGSVIEHLLKAHNTKSKYKCQNCDMKSNQYNAFANHFASKHPGEKVAYVQSIIKVNSSTLDPQSACSSGDFSKDNFDTTPLWQRGAPRVRHIRGILIEEEEIKTKKSKKMTDEGESEPGVPEAVVASSSFYCPLCTDKRKAFHTRNADCFRIHLYQELNYQQFACILCGKMFVDKKEFEKHHARVHPDKPQSMKQTKEDGEIKFWVDKVIEKQKKQMDKKRRLSEDDSNDGSNKKKKEG